MDEGRLGAVRRQQDYHRKTTIVMNDIINFQQNVYSCYLSRERQTAEQKLKAQEVYLKRSIVRNNFLLRCLEARKQKIAERYPEKLVLGRYGGRPIHAYSKDVEACIAWRHPRLRRLRRVKQAKEWSIRKGAIMDFGTVPDKVQAIMQRNTTTESDTTLDNNAHNNQHKSDHSKTRRNSRNSIKRFQPLSFHRVRNILPPSSIIDPRPKLSLRPVLPSIPSDVLQNDDDKNDNGNQKRHNQNIDDDSNDNCNKTSVSSCSKIDNNNDDNNTNYNVNCNQKRSVRIREDGGESRKLKQGIYRDGSKDNVNKTDDEKRKSSTSSSNSNKSKGNSNTLQKRSKYSPNNKIHGNALLEIKNESKGSKDVVVEIENMENIKNEKPKEKMTSSNSGKTPPPLVRRPTLILPPIQTTKEMKKIGFVNTSVHR